MELLIPVGIILLTGLIGSIIIEIYDYVQMSRWMHQRHMRELKLAMRQLERPEFFSRTYDVSADEIKRAMHVYKTSGVTTTLPTGEVEELGPGKVFIFDKQKVGTVTSTVGYEQLEEMGATLDEVERLLKEARDRTVN